MAAVFEQLTEEERLLSRLKDQMYPWQNGFICGSDNKVLFRLGYVGRKMASMYGKGLDKSRVPSGSNSCEAFQTAQFG